MNSFPDCLDGVPSLKSRVDFGEEAANETASRNGFFTAKSVNYVPSRSSGHGDDQNHQKSSKIITVELYAPTIIIRNHQKSSTIIIFLGREGIFDSNLRYTPSQQALLEHKGVCPIVGLEPL